MLNDALKAAVAEAIAQHQGVPSVSLQHFDSLGGGCINYAMRVETNAGVYFVKTNDDGKYPRMFATEATGLRYLKETNTVYIPEVIGHGAAGGEAFLVTEFVESGVPGQHFWDDFGRNLAQMHRHTAKQYGFKEDNYIGSLPQYNQWHNNWTTFFNEMRLQPQIKRAADNGLLDSSRLQQFERLTARLPEIFTDEPPSLIHGDLWSGNFMTADNGQACIYDPAVYYGHREMELAFTRLFGGYSPQFYQAYEEAWPLQPGFAQRKDVYNLYPLLVHVNLFGLSYRSQVDAILKAFT